MAMNRSILWRLRDQNVQKAAYWFLLTAIFFTYWLFSRRYTGPAYLSDEIGYLSKAAALAGFPVDMATDWHGGYSLLIAPVFVMFSDPFAVWQGVLIVNAAMWVGSFAALFYVLQRLFPETRFSAIFLAVAFSAMYPAWITMSGYAFSTPAFVIVFMASLLALLNFREDRPLGAPLIIFSLLVGYLYWIHPTGAATAVASVLVIGVWCWWRREFTPLLCHALILVVLLVVYEWGVHPWLRDLMTPAGYQPWGHYEEPSSVLGRFFDVETLLAMAVVAAGHLGYLVVATFGIIGVAAVEIWQRARHGLMRNEVNGKRDERRDTSTIVASFIGLSSLGIIALAALSFSEEAAFAKLRPDHWIYGRYSEVVLLPALGIGLLGLWRLRIFFGSGVFLLLVALMFLGYVDDGNTKDFNNLVNIPSFWPVSLFPGLGFELWLLAAAAAVIPIGILGKRWMALLVLPIFAVAVADQRDWHSEILAGYSDPSSVVHFVRQNYEPGTCVGFDERRPDNAEPNTRERRNMYSFYLYEYDFRRMSPTEWSGECGGPYLTFYGTSLAERLDVAVIGRIKSNGLFVLTEPGFVNELMLPAGAKNSSDVYWSRDGGDPCILKGCFEMEAGELAQHSNVGRLEDGWIYTEGRAGVLFYGPYSSLRSGDYQLELRGRFSEWGDAVLDVVSDKGRSQHLRVALSGCCEPKSGAVNLPFSLNQDVQDLEIRLHVSPDTKIAVQGYDVELR